MRNFQVPEKRIRVVRPGQSYKIKDIEVEILPNYDRIATMTGGPGVKVEPGVRRPFDDVAATFFFKIGGYNFCHLADSLFQNAYVTFKKHKIDVLSVNIGYNAPGGTDKMTPYDAVRLAEAAGHQGPDADALGQLGQHDRRPGGSELDRQAARARPQGHHPAVGRAVALPGAGRTSAR